MSNSGARTAVVTGATGLVGSWIVRLLSEQGWHIRVLTRKTNASIDSAEIYQGGLDNVSLLESMVDGVDAVFHCAAELRNDELMYSTNVEGTSNLLMAMVDKGISYFCYLSSVGVMGPYVSGVVDENSRCFPVGNYEKSKFDAENLVRESSICNKVVILRPTNVVDASNPGVLSLLDGGMKNTIMLFFKGSENHHLVHAGDVANAAIHFFNKEFCGTECYIVSRDEKYSSLAEMCSSLRDNADKMMGLQFYLPWRAVHLVRKAIRGVSLKGDVVFSSNHLVENGFNFAFDLQDVLNEFVCGGARQ